MKSSCECLKYHGKSNVAFTSSEVNLETHGFNPDFEAM